jgi:membrane protein DedA with SNARE-associated domain
MRFKLTVSLMLILGLAGFLPAPGPPLAASPAAPAARDRGKAPESQPGWLARDLERGIARVQPALSRYGYAAVFLSIMVEGFGIIAPGQTFLIAAAVTASQGKLNIIWVVIGAFIAAVLGNSLGYLLGRWGGRSLLARFKARGDRLARLEGYFRRYGQGLVLIARFFDGLRQLNGIVAGILKMPGGLFTTVNVLGAILWVAVWGVGPYFLGKKISTIHIAFRTIEPGVVALSLIAFLALIVYLLRHRQKPTDHIT